MRNTPRSVSGREAVGGEIGAQFGARDVEFHDHLVGRGGPVVVADKDAPASRHHQPGELHVVMAVVRTGIGLVGLTNSGR